MQLEKLIKWAYLLCCSLILVSCHKIPYYPISDSAKGYFSYKQGSYWIYRNDSTNSIDSTSINMISYFPNDESYPGLTREVIVTLYTSSFLSETVLDYETCGGSDFYSISSINPLLPPGEINGGWRVSYCSSWAPNTIIYPSCISDAIFYYSTRESDTINGVTYKNLIYSELRTKDTTSNYQYRSIRKIIFAKNIGIVKYYEYCPENKINYSFSLLRSKVLQ